MPWSNSRPGSAAKYRTAEHKRARAAALAELARLGSVECAQPICVMPSRTIFDGEPTHLGHDDTGTHYIGLVHPSCNVKDGARRGNRRSRGETDTPMRRWAL